MAEKTIGIRIQLNGLNTVITDIKTFEDEIRKAKEDLKEVEIGGKVFNQLSQEIGLAESQLLGLIQSTKRLTKEREIEGIGKLGQGIASSFAAATAAVSLFGVKDEEVTKAATAAQNLLTLALSARGIAEIKLGAQLVARTISERAAAAANRLNTVANVQETASVEASTVAFETNTVAEVANTTATRANSVATTVATAVTNGFNATLKALYATLAANPYGAIIAAIGLLVSAFLLLGSTEEEETKKYKTLNQIRAEGIGQTNVEIAKIQILTGIINDNNASLLARQGAYAELQKLVPELAGLTLEEAQSQNILNVAIEREIKLIGLRAEQKALENYMVQEAEKALDAQNKQREKYIESLKQESIWTQVNNLLLKVYWGVNNPNKNQKEINRLENESLNVKGQLADITKKIVTLQAEANKTIENTKKNTKDVKDVEEERRKKQIELAKALAERLKIEAALISQTFALQQLDNKILKTTEDNVKAAQDYANALNKQRAITELYVDVNKKLEGSQDNVGKAFDEGQKMLEAYYNKLKEGKMTDADAAKALDTVKNSLIQLKTQYGLSEKEAETLDTLRLNYQSLFNTIREYQDVKGITPPFNADEFEQALIDYNLALGKLANDPIEIFDKVTGESRRRTQDELAEAKRTAAERFKVLEESFVKSYVKIKEAEAIAAGTLIKSNKDAVAEFERGAAEAGKVAFANLQKTGEEIIKFEQDVFLTTKKVADLNKELEKLAPAARQGFLLENADEIAKQLGTTIPLVLRNEKELSKLQTEIAQRTFDKKKEFAEAVNVLEADLLAQGLDISVLTYEQKLVILEKYLKKEVDATTKAEKEKEDKVKATIDGVRKAVDMFSSYVGELASLVQQSYQLQLDALETNNKKALDSVVGDTEEANQKRLELTQQYETQKAALEKEALIKSLQFQKVQAAASLASALLQTYADFGFTPAGYIAGGIGVALAAYQIALIQDQINQARSMAGGGYIFGPSHEKGGVMAGGGYNLEGGESVINRVSTVQYGNLLSSINQMGGGRAIVNAQSSGMMEERLMQALAKTNNEPIRAYVINSDIENAQSVNKRLSQLASF